MTNLKKVLMAGVTAGMLATSAPSMAGGSWIGAGASALGVLYGAAMAYLNGGEVVNMLFGNLDPAQLVAEGLVLYQMYNIKDTWDPEPAEEYQQASESNGGSGGGSGSGGVTYDSAVQKLSFQTASLYNVGIEAVGVGRMLAEIATPETRQKLVEQLGYVKEKGTAVTASATTTETEENPGAGSCAASYSFCLKEMTTTEMDEVSSRQKLNEQNYGTAGIAHAELGLKSVQQAIANDGDSALDKKSTSNSSDDATLSTTSTVKVQDLSKLIGTGANTVAAMKIVALMNLELAQRLNQGNMLQGSALTIEAARAFQNTSGITD